MKDWNLFSVFLLILALHLSWCREMRGYFTNRFAVQVEGGREVASSIAETHGLTNFGLIANLQNVYLFQVGGDESIYTTNNSVWLTMVDALSSDRQVTYVEPEFKRPVKQHFYTDPTDPLWDDQWFILNTGQLGASSVQNDVNAEPVWIQGITGCNVKVAVVDTGAQYTHPDLAPNYDPGISLDICGNDPDPLPPIPSETHGTSVAGEIVSVKSNSECGTGVAYNAIFGSIRLIACFISDIDIANALTYENQVVQIYSNSWGPVGDGNTVIGPGPVLQMSLQTAVDTGRGGKGSVFVFSTGNDGRFDDDCSSNGYCTSIYTIGIGSASVTGAQAFYDETCSCKMAVNFVSGTPSLSVATTHPVDGCTLQFDGTSAACPVASAVIALALEVNSDLTWRDVQYLTAYTSSHQRLTGGSISVNGGGLAVSHEFGFGAMNAEALVSRARHWITVPPQQFTDIIPTPDNGAALFGSPLVITFVYDDNILYLEHVVATMTVGVDMGNRGDLRVELTSPYGTTSVLVDYRNNDFGVGDYPGWGFMSVHYWGENPYGQWTLTIMSQSVSSPVDMSGLVVTLYGTDETPEVIDNIPEQCDSACDGGCAGPGADYCDACVDLRNAHTGECITQCPVGYVERNGYCFDPAIPEPVCLSERTVMFTQEMYTVNEAVASQNLALLVCILADVTGTDFSVALIPVSGTALVNVDFVEGPIVLEFQSGGSTQECGCIEILDDTIIEGTENFLIELSVSSTSGVTIVGDSSVIVEIEDDDVDDRLMFINDTPRVTANGMTAQFIVGVSFTTVSCKVNTQDEKICSEGSVTFDGLNPDRRAPYKLTITGSLPSDNIVTLERRFYVGTNGDCRAHLINDGITVNGDSATIEWQSTGPGADEIPPLSNECRLRTFTSYEPCSSPHTFSGLSSGEYTVNIRHDDPDDVCTRRNKATFEFEII